MEVSLIGRCLEKEDYGGKDYGDEERDESQVHQMIEVDRQSM